jgi:hypothetical protein
VWLPIFAKSSKSKSSKSKSAKNSKGAKSSGKDVLYLQSLTDFTPVIENSGPSNKVYMTVIIGVVTLAVFSGILSL